MSHLLASSLAKHDNYSSVCLLRKIGLHPLLLRYGQADGEIVVLWKAESGRDMLALDILEQTLPSGNSLAVAPHGGGG